MPLLLIAGLGTGRWEFYFLLTAFVLLIIVAFALNVWTFLSFSCRYEMTDEIVTKGDSPTLKIYISNNKPFSLNTVRAIVKTPLPSDEIHMAIDVAPGETVCYDIKLSCKHRGIYEVGITKLEVTDLFGILRIRFNLRHRTNHGPEQIIVYPRLLELSSTFAHSQGEAMCRGVDKRQITEYGDDYHDTRKYRYGDPLKRVHRTISVRKRELYIKNYDIPMETSIIIVIDACESHITGEDALCYNDVVSECAVAVAHYHINMGHAVTVISSAENEPIVEGKRPSDFPIIFGNLAIMNLKKHNDIDFMLQIKSMNKSNPGAVYVISSRSDKIFTDTLTSLAQSGKYVRLLFPIMQSTDEKNQAGIDINGVISTAVRSADDIAYQ